MHDRVEPVRLRAGQGKGGSGSPVFAGFLAAGAATGHIAMAIEDRGKVERRRDNSYSSHTTYYSHGKYNNSHNGVKSQESGVRSQDSCIRGQTKRAIKE